MIRRYSELSGSDTNATQHSQDQFQAAETQTPETPGPTGAQQRNALPVRRRPQNRQPPARHQPHRQQRQGHDSLRPIRPSRRRRIGPDQFRPHCRPRKSLGFLVDGTQHEGARESAAMPDEPTAIPPGTQRRCLYQGCNQIFACTGDPGEARCPKHRRTPPTPVTYITGDMKRRARPLQPWLLRALSE